MGKHAFEEFLKETKAVVKSNVIDWREVKTDWIKQIEKLYTDVEAWLLSSKNAKEINIKRETEHLSEENFGAYETPKLKINLINQEVVLVPAGRFILGAQGRVDMTGVFGTVKFYLVDKNAVKPGFKNITDKTSKKPAKASEKPVWKIGSRTVPLTFIDLTEDTFFEVLMKIVKS